MVQIRKIIVAANRGPLYFVEDESSSSPGQLIGKRDSSRASELFDPLVNVPITWVSAAVGAADRNAVEQLGSSGGEIRSSAIPDSWSVRFVSPPRRVHHKFYNVICNPLLWFVLHRSWSPTFTPNIGEQEHDAWERGYRVVNESFAREIVGAAGEQQFAVLCRDYQMMLVPGLVRKMRPESVIHQSFDTPWPWPSEFELLPAAWRIELMESLLSADVISFPSTNDIDAFAFCVRMYSSDVVVDGGTISRAGQNVRLTVAAPQIRSEKFKSITELPGTRRHIDDLADDRYSHTFITVDRSEPHKNIVRSINAFGGLLVKQPDLARNVRFLLYLTPGPAHISAYKRLSDEIRRSARRINENFDGVNPVQVREENNFYRAVAALSIYDTLVSVPVVDGAGRAALDGPVVNSRDGGMILSETNVASGIYGDLVPTVSITDVAAMTRAMAEAVSEPPDQRKRNADAMREIVAAESGGASDLSIRQILAELASIDSRK